MEIFAKAKELADAIATSEELANLKEAELNMMLDENARNIVEEYQGIQMEAMQSGLSYEDLSDEQRAKVEELEAKMGENQNITNFMAANQAFEQIIRSVNTIIGSAINGGGGCGGSCGGSCGTEESGCDCGGSCGC